jgi:Family of unknown function (DUF6283)
MCKSCPWRVDAKADDIPAFDMEKAEGLVDCNSGLFGAPIMACHLSTEGNDIPCAGWLAREGANNIFVRLRVASGNTDPAALVLSPDWPETHASYDEVLRKLRSTWSGS